MAGLRRAGPLSVALALSVAFGAVLAAAPGSLSFLELDRDGFSGVEGLDLVRSVAVSPDDKHVYATGAFDDAIATFERDQASGALSFVEIDKDGVGGVDGMLYPEDVAVSPDGSHVYVAARNDDAVATFARNPATGALTFVEFDKDGAGGVDGIDQASEVTVSPDGNNVYVTGQGDGAVATFARNATTGALTFVEFDQDGAGGVEGIGGATSAVVSGDGGHAYVTGFASDAVATFSRSPATGALTFVEFDKDGLAGVDGLDEANQVVVSNDGSHAYVAGVGDDAVAVFARSSATGVLSFLEVHRDGIAGMDGLDGASDLAMSGDNLYVASDFDNAVATLARTPSTGGLSFVELDRDGVAGVDGISATVAVAASADGRNAYVAGQADDAVATFARESVRCAGRAVTLVGGSGNDVLTGTGGEDVIAGLDGNDRILSGGGDDVVCAGNGNDKVRGGNGQDEVRGEDGDDSLKGQAGDDLILGGKGDDVLIGGSGKDRLKDGPGKDRERQ